MATITKKQFFEAMQSQMKGKSNYECNLLFNFGRWNYCDIYKCIINGTTYYFGGRAKNASTSISSIKRLCN